ncbi:MAG: beta-galactosidase [Lentisphaeria bacterium]|nr:beta-galactosidase [Lentisphaeria bacterium]
MKLGIKFTLAAILTLGSAAQIFADWSKDGEYPWGKLDEKNVTPHRQLYKPLSGKKPKIFFLGYNKGMREIAEFRQRFECDFQYWPALNKKAFSAFEPKPQKIYAASMDEQDYRAERKRIFADLNNCNAIIIGKFQFSDIPADIRKQMLDLVKKGAPMLLILQDAKLPVISGATFKPEKIPANIPVAAIPDLQKTKLYAATVGKGKIFAIAYNKPANRYPLENMVPYNSNDPLYYEYNYAFLGALIRQELAKNVPSITLQQNVAAINGKLPSGAKIRIEYLDRLGNVVSKKTMAARNGANAITTPADLSASVVMMDAFLTDAAGKVINYAATPFVSPRKNKIISFKLDQDIVKKDRKFSGIVTMSGKPAGTLSFRAVDNEGRLIFVKDIKAKGGANKFAWQFPPFDSLSAKLNVKYLENGKIADEYQCAVYFPIDQKLIHNDFQFAIWENISDSRISESILKDLKKAGIDVLMETSVMFDTATAATHPRTLHKAGIAYAIYLTRLVGTHKYQKLCNLSLADAVRENKSYLDKNGRPFAANYNTIKKIVTESSKFGTAFYNLGDENSLTDHAKDENCFCKECKVRFRKFLKNMYGTIDKVNAQYNSKFKSFDEIEAMPLDKAAEKELLSMWIDFRAFMDYSFTEWHKMVAGQVRSMDKTSPIGIEGLVYPYKTYSGFDLAQMLPNFTFCAPYFISRDIHALKYMGKNAVKSAWFGTYEGEMNEQYSRQPPWRYLFAGLGGAFYWYAGNPGYSNATIYRMDLGYLSQFRHTSDEIAKIKNSGIGKLIKDSKIRNDKVAIHYSQACLHAANLNPDQTTWELSIGNMGDLIESTGLDYEYLTPAEITAGKLKTFKALFLPNSQALSKAEVKAMKEFVRNGGLLVADYNPGIMDEHGKFLDDSQLADVFGAMDKLNVKRYGKGTAVILHNYLDGAAQKVQKGTATGIQRGILALLKKHAGTAPVVQALDSQDNIAEYKAYTNEKGDHYLCFLGPITEAGEAKKSTAGAEAGAAAAIISSGNMTRTVKMKTPMHVYDLNNGKYLGKLKEFKFDLAPATGRVFAITPAKAPAPGLKGAVKLEKGKAANYTLSGVNNPVRVTITAPDGKTVFTRNVSAKTAFQFVPSYDLPAGEYTIRARNIIGGAEKVMKANLK